MITVTQCRAGDICLPLGLCKEAVKESKWRRTAPHDPLHEPHQNKENTEINIPQQQKLLDREAGRNMYSNIKK